MRVYLSHSEGPGGLAVTGLADSEDFMVNSNGAQMEPNGGQMEPNGAQKEFKWSSNGAQWSFNGASMEPGGRGRFKEGYKIYKIYNI